HFSFESHDRQPRTEERLEAQVSLLLLKTPPPADAEKKQLMDTISGSHEKIPSWISSPPRPTASNQAMELTASRRTTRFSMTSTVSFAAARGPARSSSSLSR